MKTWTALASSWFEPARLDCALREASDLFPVLVRLRGGAMALFLHEPVQTDVNLTEIAVSFMERHMGRHSDACLISAMADGSALKMGYRTVAGSRACDWPRTARRIYLPLTEDDAVFILYERNDSGGIGGVLDAARSEQEAAVTGRLHRRGLWVQFEETKPSGDLVKIVERPDIPVGVLRKEKETHV